LGISSGLGGLAAAATAAAAANAQIASTHVQAHAQQTTGLEVPVATATSSSSTLSTSLSDQNPSMEGHAVQQMLDNSSLSSLSTVMGASSPVGLSGPGSGYYHNQSQSEIPQPSAPPGPQDLGRATLM